jgi:hypothetical protein
MFLAGCVSKAVPSLAHTAVPEARFPQPGDTWTYRLVERQIGGSPSQRNYVVKVAASSEANILDRVSQDGAPPAEWTHGRGNYLVAQGVSVFSPYLAVFEDLTPGTAIRRIAEHHDECFMKYRCVAEGKVVGWERVQVPAGGFDAIKVTVEQEWRLRQTRTASEHGVRRLTVWYSPQAKRAVKVSSRMTGRGGRPPFDTEFDLELTSYQLK